VAAAGATLAAACGPGVAAPAGAGAVGAAPAPSSSVRASSTAPATSSSAAVHTVAPAGVKQVDVTTRAPKQAAAPKQAVGAPCSATARACVDLSANRAWLLNGGKVVYGPVPITSGRPGQRTPPGTFHVQWKDKNHRSSEFNNAPMPYSVFFYSGMAFHAGSLNNQSAGCIHLSTSAARTFFNSLSVGDVVQVVR
jgi:lipoprotein-anchoring transpeptidase ErfK/SrfK